MAISKEINLARLEIAARMVQVTDDRELAEANEILRAAKSGFRRTQEQIAPGKEASWRAYKWVQQLEKKALGRWQNVIDIVQGAMRPYVEAQERAAVEERRRVAEAAEALRQAAEAEANKLAKRGRIEEAEVARQAAELTIAPVLPEEKIELDGSQIRHTWEVEVTDLMALAQAVVAGQAPLDCIQANEKFLRSMARQQQPEGELYPGVKAVKVVGFAHSRE